MLSVCPTSLAVRLPDRGSQVLITLSGVPEAITVPPESTAIAYTEALDPVLSGDLRVMRGSEPVGELRFKSHNLIVLSKEPDATQFWSRLNERRMRKVECMRNSKSGYQCARHRT